MVFSAHALPSDPRLWPPVTNAHLGTRVYHDVIHMSGLYNGTQGDTHRAVLPSPLNVRMEAPPGSAEPLTETFTLDTRTGSCCGSGCPWWVLEGHTVGPPGALGLEASSLG